MSTSVRFRRLPTNTHQPSSGLVEAKQAVCQKFKRDNHLEYAPSQVMLTCGGKEAIFLALAAVVNPGDEVLLPVPYWVSFPEQIKLCGGKPVFLYGDESRSFKLRPDQITAALTPRTRMLIFNSPSNPGGFTYSLDETTPYYISTGGSITATQQIVGPLDVTGNVGRQSLNYRSTDPTGARDRIDHVNIYGGGVGFRVGNSVRVGMNIEQWRRSSSDAAIGRTYDRMRIFASLTYGI